MREARDAGGCVLNRRVWFPRGNRVFGEGAEHGTRGACAPRTVKHIRMGEGRNHVFKL